MGITSELHKNIKKNRKGLKKRVQSVLSLLTSEALALTASPDYHWQSRWLQNAVTVSQNQNLLILKEINATTGLAKAKCTLRGTDTLSFYSTKIRLDTLGRLADDQ